VALKVENIGVIGLGYVGLPLAIEFGKSKMTIGLDIDQSRIKDLKNGLDKTLEVAPCDLEASRYLSLTSDYCDLSECDVFIVTVPTPIDDVKRPDLRPLVGASESIAKLLKPGNIVIYESTVYPGCTEEICIPILEAGSGMKFNEDFYCGYSPERINPGDKVNTLTKIRKITSGSTPIVAEVIDRLYGSIIEAGTFMATSIKVAEAAKVIENSQRDLNIAFVNELSLIFDYIGIDTTEVLEAAGSKWNFLPFRPGLVGGHCIGIDPYYLTHKAEQLGYKPQVILGGRKINDEMARHTARNIIKKMALNKIDISTAKVAVLGVTFKDNCPDIRNSKVFDLIDELESWNVSVILIDPWASESEVKISYGYTLESISSDIEVDSIVVSVAHDEFKKLKIHEFKSICRSSNPVFGDLKSAFSKSDLESAGFTVVRL